MREIDPNKVVVMQFNNSNTIKFNIIKFLDIESAIYNAVTKVHGLLKDKRLNLSLTGFGLSYLDPRLCWYMSIANYINSRFIRNSNKIYNSLMINTDKNYVVLEYINGVGNIEKLPIKFSNSEVDVLSGVYAFINKKYNDAKQKNKLGCADFKQFSEIMFITIIENDIKRAVRNPIFRLKYLFLNSIRMRRYA